MKNDNITDSLASALYSALYVDLPDVEYRKMFNSEETGIRRPKKTEVTTYHFEQSWGSTSLGFKGMGGTSMTNAYTSVIIMNDKNIATVYFDGQLAYKCSLSLEFWNMLFKFNMPGQSEASDKLTILK